MYPRKTRDNGNVTDEFNIQRPRTRMTQENRTGEPLLSMKNTTVGIINCHYFYRPTSLCMLYESRNPGTHVYGKK